MIASRRSRLARVQAEAVGGALKKLHPRLDIEYRWIDSEGDQQPHRSLAGVGGKGLFTRTLEKAVLAGEADLAVHSLKDMPAVDTPGLTLAAVPRRADVRDCLIARDGVGLDDLPADAVVGTSSPRRAAQVLRLRPDVRVSVIRGNVDTRLRKVIEPEGEPAYDATLLAVAGLLRLGLREHVTHLMPLEQMLPAACQGALAIQCRADDHVALTRCLPLNDATVATAVHAERQVVAALEADCHSPICVLCEPVPPQAKTKRNTDAHWYRLRTRVLSSDGRTCLETDATSSPKDLRRTVRQAVDQLVQQNARRVLAASREIPEQRDRTAPVAAE